VVEFRGHLRSEKPSCSTWRNSPGVDIIGVRPHQVTVRSFVRNFLAAFDKADLVKSLNIGRKTSMDAENFALDNGTGAKQIEDFGAVLPRVSVSILAHALIVVSIDLRDLASLMVSTEESDVSGVLHFQAEQELESLN